MITLTVWGSARERVLKCLLESGADAAEIERVRRGEPAVVVLNPVSGLSEALSGLGAAAALDATGVALSPGQRLAGVVADAERFGRRAHEGMTRPNRARSPYGEHLAEVAALIDQAGGSDEEVAAAWLHDTVESTGVSLGDIRRAFGAHITRLVDDLTDPPGFDALPLRDRKARQAERIGRKCASVRRLKLADQVSNVRALAADPPADWVKQACRDYLAGARLVADACRGASPALDLAFDEAHRAACRVHAAV